MTEHPIVRVGFGLYHPWEIQTNLDGTKTLLVREGLRLTRGAADLINDLHADRAPRAPESPVCPPLQRMRAWPPPAPGRSPVIARLIHDPNTNGHRLLITCGLLPSYTITNELYPEPDDDDEPPENTTCA